ncbi:hypothetical protein [Gluconobacter oxydans]|uniref:hypothetical protein n=1 Tax=Gluconobacter oxydans TaxID=442 RepID=UPI0039EC80A5
MPDENVFDLPQPVDREAPFQLLVLQRLDQIGETLAQIHEMVSPPEKAEEGEGLVEVVARMAQAMEQQGAALETISAQLGRLEASTFSAPAGR